MSARTFRTRAAQWGQAVSAAAADYRYLARRRAEQPLPGSRTR